MGSFSYRAFFTGIQSAAFTLLILLTQSACPNNPDPLECGENQTEVNGSCECAEGYHWNENQTQCNMDTTSHDFIWEIDTLGDYGSYLNDVAIIDENNVWVVGYIKTADSTYNAARWDGSEWKFSGIYSNTLNLYSIKWFSENDIWVTSHCFPYHWDGSTWTQYHLNDMGLEGVCVGNTIWGTSPLDIYLVGVNGSIVHYDGSEFTRMESGTDVDLKDITGVVDEETGETRIWVTGQLTLLFYDGIEWQTICDEENPLFPDNYKHPAALYMPDKDNLIVASWNGGNSRLYVLNQHNPREYYQLTSQKLLVHGIDGIGLNDILTAGSSSAGKKVYHFNGSTSLSYQETLISGIYEGLAKHGDHVFITGWLSNQSAIVAHGVR